MKLIENLINPFRHCENTVFFLLKTLDVKFTKSALQKELQAHPDYPSMMSIADVIGISYNIACVPLKIVRKNIEAAAEIKPPFVAQVKGSNLMHELFVVITHFSGGYIDFYTPETKRVETLSMEIFDKIYNGTILVVEKGKPMIEHNYVNNRKQEKRTHLILLLLVCFMPAITIIMCIAVMIHNTNTASVAFVIFTLNTLFGCIISIALLWHEIDEYSPILSKFCQSRKNTDCAAILNSRASKIFGLSWSSVGFVYFTGMLLSILAGSSSIHTLTILSWVNIITLPYIVFSIYYQWKIARQWCLLCLIVQALLLLQFIAALVGGFHNLLSLPTISFSAYVTVIALFVFVVMVIIILMSALQIVKANNHKIIDFQRFKRNPKIFEALLSKQKKIKQPLHDLGFILGNPNGIFKLIKVCNLYCKACANSYSAIHTLLENNDEVCLQMIFTSTEDENDISKKSVMRLLTIAETNNEILIKKALADWYNAPSLGNRADFTIEYPLNQKTKTQEAKINAMREWCLANRIGFTPTFFICLNTAAVKPIFYQLPELYNVNELKYFLSI